MTVEHVDAITGEVVEIMDKTEARRLTTEAQSEFRSAVAHHEHGWRLVAEAIKAGGHAALGYRSASEYMEHEFAEVLAGLDASARRVAVHELSALGMSTRAIAPVVGVSQKTADRDVRQVSHRDSPEPESLPTDPEPVSDPTPAKIIGRDGKSYARPQTTGPKEAQKETPMTAAPSRLAIPRPPKYGGGRRSHNQIISGALISASGLCIGLDEITALDGSIDSEEAAGYARDLSNILRSLKRIQSLLTKEV